LKKLFKASAENFNFTLWLGLPLIKKTMDLPTHHSKLNKERVVTYIGRWIKSNYGAIPFAIAGSYAAAVAAYEHDPSWRLKFNDIDV
jgi:hypothetical protein